MRPASLFLIWLWRMGLDGSATSYSAALGLSVNIRAWRMKRFILLALFCAPLIARAQTVTLSGGVQEYVSFTGATVNRSG